MINKENNYSGYYWLSDMDRPTIVNGLFDKELNPNTIPFIVEAQLYDEMNKTSYSIRYVDGEYLVKEYRITENDENDGRLEVSYVGNKMEDHARLKFLQCWECEPDDLCEGMLVEKPAQFVFIGFEK